MTKSAVGTGVAATGRVVVISAGAVMTVGSVVVAGAARGEVNAVVGLVDAVAVRLAVSVGERVAVRLAGSDAVIGVATGESGDS